MRRIVLMVALVGAILLTACSSDKPAPPASGRANHNQVIPAALLQGSSVNDWPMFGYDLGHTNYVDPAIHPGRIQGNVQWTQKFGPIFSSPVAGLGMLYIAGTDGYLYALEQASGTVIWRVRLGNYLSDATPALEGQVLFVATQSSAIEALDAHNGHVYWTFDTAEKIQTPPVVVGNRILVASRTILWVLNAASGQLLWKFHRGYNSWPTTGSPAVIGNTVYLGLGSSSQIWALNLVDGHLLWSFETSDRIMSSLMGSVDTVYVATWRGTIFALERSTGKLRWSYLLNTVHNQSVVDGVGSSMALAEGNLYVGDYRGSVLCIDVQHGKLLWRFATGAAVLATPIVAAGLVYIGSGDGNLYALNIQTGRPAWRYATGELRNSTLLTNGHLYVGSITGVVYAFT